MTDLQAKRRSLRIARWWCHLWSPGQTFRDKRGDLYLSLGRSGDSRPDWPLIAYVGEYCHGKMHIDILKRNHHFSKPRTPAERNMVSILAQAHGVALYPKRSRR